MIVSNLLFDIVLFGALLLGVIVDKIFPQLAGAASLVAVGVALYIASQEWSDALLKTKRWTQEALSTAIALSVLGFIYFWWRNQSDFSLLALSVVLMMASLMVAIASIAAVGNAIKEASAAPIAGWFYTACGALVLGILGGVLALFLGNGATLFAKILLLGIGLFGWKIRETMRPPRANVHAHNAALPEKIEDENKSDTAPHETAPHETAPSDFDLSFPATHAARWFLIPQRGTLLDRFVPILILGALLFVAASQIKSPDLWTPTPPASADNGNFDNGSSDNGADNGSTP